MKVLVSQSQVHDHSLLLLCQTMYTALPSQLLSLGVWEKLCLQEKKGKKTPTSPLSCQPPTYPLADAQDQAADLNLAV